MSKYTTANISQKYLYKKILKYNIKDIDSGTVVDAKVAPYTL